MRQANSKLARLTAAVLLASAFALAGCGGGASSTSSTATSATSTTSTAATSTSGSASGGIPQGPNAGDKDADNSGGPSDGDGNL